MDKIIIMSPHKKGDGTAEGAKRWAGASRWCLFVAGKHQKVDFCVLFSTVSKSHCRKYQLLGQKLSKTGFIFDSVQI
jgi:hypothetical protein